MTDALEDHLGTVNIGGTTVTNLRFADDIDGLAGDEQELVNLVSRIDETSASYRIEISAEKTKLMTNNTNGINKKIKVRGQRLETVSNFKYWVRLSPMRDPNLRSFQGFHNIIQQAIGPYEDPLTTVNILKLKRYGHVSRTSGLTKTILQGTAMGARRRGRQRKRWEEHISQWTGLDFSETQRRQVARSSVAPQRHSGLRD